MTSRDWPVWLHQEGGDTTQAPHYVLLLHFLALFYALSLPAWLVQKYLLDSKARGPQQLGARWHVDICDGEATAGRERFWFCSSKMCFLHSRLFLLSLFSNMHFFKKHNSLQIQSSWQNWIQWKMSCYKKTWDAWALLEEPGHNGDSGMQVWSPHWC